MGKLSTQGTRERFHVSEKTLDDFFSEAENIAKKYSISIETVIEAKQALEMERKNNIAAQAGDYHDEQAGGFGKILSEIAGTLDDIANR